MRKLLDKILAFKATSKICFISIFIIVLISFVINFIFVYKIVKEHLYAKTVPVLLYHDVDIIENAQKYYSGDFITIEKFEKQMDFLKRHHYKTLTLDEFYDFVTEKRSFPKRSILITFDGGRKDVLKNAYPILKKNAFHASYFILTSKISNDNMYMDWNELKTISDVFEFASHTHNLHFYEGSDYKKVSILLVTSNEDINKDIQKSMEYVDKYYFAYPYGKYDKRTISLLKKMGFKLAFTTRLGSVRTGDDLFEIKRNTINQKTSFKKFKKIIGYKK